MQEYAKRIAAIDVIYFLRREKKHLFIFRNRPEK